MMDELEQRARYLAWKWATETGRAGMSDAPLTECEAFAEWLIANHKVILKEPKHICVCEECGESFPSFRVNGQRFCKRMCAHVNGTRRRRGGGRRKATEKAKAQD